MIFGIGAHIEDKKDVDLPVKSAWFVSSLSDNPSFESFLNKEDAVNYAKRFAQRVDRLVAVYEAKLIGSSGPSESTYQEFK